MAVGAFPETITVISLVRKRRVGGVTGMFIRGFGGSVVGCFAARQDEADRQALIVTAGMNFARKAAA